MKILVKAIIENEPYHLDLTLVAGKAGLQRPITHTRVQKPGIALAGFRQSVRSDRVQIFGKTEIAYLNHLDEPARRAHLRWLQMERGAGNGEPPKGKGPLRTDHSHRPPSR